MVHEYVQLILSVVEYRPHIYGKPLLSLSARCSALLTMTLSPSLSTHGHPDSLLRLVEQLAKTR